MLFMVEPCVAALESDFVDVIWPEFPPNNFPVVNQLCTVNAQEVVLDWKYKFSPTIDDYAAKLLFSVCCAMVLWQWTWKYDQTDRSVIHFKTELFRYFPLYIPFKLLLPCSGL